MSRNNNLVNKFQSYKNNTPFGNNPLLNNNPAFIANSRDSSFYNKINMAKLEQIKRAKNIDDMGIDKKQITDLVICPIIINKTKKTELDDAFNEITNNYDKNNNKILQEWWNSRTNQPYKNIIKKDLFNKDFKKYYKEDIFNKNIKDKKELLVHKITDADSDSLLLETEFELLSNIIEKHNNELKVIYSSSKKNKYKKEFEYVQNYRYRLEYNPTNSEELKEFYKKEQKKINKEKQLIDDVISTLIENDQLTTEELEKLNTKINKKSSKYNNIEDELRKELGDDYDSIINNIDIDIDDNKSDKVYKKKQNRIKSTNIKVKEQSESSEEELKPKKKITVKTIKNNNDNNDNYNDNENDKLEKKIGMVSEDIKNKYKNRQ